MCVEMQHNLIYYIEKLQTRKHAHICMYCMCRKCVTKAAAAARAAIKWAHNRNGNSRRNTM